MYFEVIVNGQMSNECLNAPTCIFVFVCVFFSFYVYIISSLLTRSKNDNNSRIIRMNPTPVTPSDSSCVFGSYTGCVDGEFMLSAFTGADMSSSVS
jgi:hypothetical protein